MIAPYSQVIDYARVAELHQLGLTAAGTISTQPNKDCVEGSLGNAWAAESYRAGDLHCTPGLLFACYLFSYLLKDHCAPDGNKRMAWLALVDVLAHYDLEIDEGDSEIEQMCAKIITDDLSGEDVLTWVSSRLRAIPHEPNEFE